MVDSMSRPSQSGGTAIVYSMTISSQSGARTMVDSLARSSHLRMIWWCLIQCTTTKSFTSNSGLWRCAAVQSAVLVRSLQVR